MNIFDGNEAFMVEVPELGHTASRELSVGSIPIMVIVKAAIVNHCRDVGVTMIVRSIVVAVGVHDDCQATEVVLAAKHFSLLHGFLHIPESKAIAKQVLPSAVNLEMYLHLPVPQVAAHCVPDGPSLALNITS